MVTSIRLTDQDKINIHIIRAMIPELKTDSAVIKYCLNVLGSAYNTVDSKLVVKNDG